MAVSNNSQYRIDFIDPLFAVAIHIGFVEGLMKERWYEKWQLPAFPAEWAHIAIFLAAMMTLVSSWVGYHVSIANRKIKSDTRFVLDVILLFLYIFLLTSFDDYRTFSVLLFLVFVTYSIWDYHKFLEYQDDDREDKGYKGEFANSLRGPRERTLGYGRFLYRCFNIAFRNRHLKSKIRGEAVTFWWMLFFLAQFLWVWSPISKSDWFGLGVAIIDICALYLYRIDKVNKNIYHRPLFKGSLAMLAATGLLAAVLRM